MEDKKLLSNAMRTAFDFTVHWDYNGFYILIGQKHNKLFHKYHPNLDAGIFPLSKRLISKNRNKHQSIFQKVAVVLLLAVTTYSQSLVNVFLQV